MFDQTWDNMFDQTWDICKYRCVPRVQQVSYIFITYPPLIKDSSLENRLPFFGVF